MFEHLDDYALTEVIAAEARASAAADARKHGAIAELERRRNTVERANWACDGWDAAAAEIAAALNLSHGRACGERNWLSRCATGFPRWLPFSWRAT